VVYYLEQVSKSDGDDAEFDLHAFELAGRSAKLVVAGVSPDAGHRLTIAAGCLAELARRFAGPRCRSSCGSNRVWRNRLRNQRTTLCSLFARAMAVMDRAVARVTPSALTMACGANVLGAHYRSRETR
jgi:hypothetical protein